MSWLISNALMRAYENSHSLPVPVAGSLAGSCSDGKPSVPSSGSLTRQAFCAPDKMMAFSRLSRFGMTFRPLTADRGEDLLTWFRAGSLAKISALPEKAQALTVPAPVCGDTWRGSLARFDPASSSWKTVQPSLLGDLDESSVIWPRSGMTAAGLCWELPMSGRRTGGIGSGLLVPTPQAQDGSGGGALITNLKSQVHLRDWAKTWPTPTVCGNYNRKGASPTSGDGLATAVARFPTPTVNDSKNSTLPESQRFRDGLAGTLLRDGVQPGGQLNPTWVEWLMGWPLGWTDLRQSATAKSAPALQPLGDY